MNAQKLISKLIDYSYRDPHWDNCISLSRDRLPLVDYILYDSILDVGYEILFALSRILQKENNYKFSVRDKETKAYSYNIKSNHYMEVPVYVHRLRPIFMTYQEMELAVNIYNHIMYGEGLDESKD